MFSGSIFNGAFNPRKTALELPLFAEYTNVYSLGLAGDLAQAGEVNVIWRGSSDFL